MESIRKWFCRPKKDDKSLLAQFFYADEALNIIANELDSFDGRKDPERCTTLVNQLRQSQDKVLTITNAIMDVLIGDERANRDFRVKFPEDVLQENLAGQLWFGAECLAAGSSIMNREAESTAMRPLAKAVTKSLENVRNLLRETCLRNNTPNGPIKLDNNELITEMLLESLKIFDKLFSEFELAYVSAMVPVKTTQEYELQEFICVLFSETLQRALKMKLLTQLMIDQCDPSLMFTIPRLAIVNGLLIYPNGPLSIDKPIDEMSTMFRPFRTLLIKIRQLLLTLKIRELYNLEKLLCDNEQINDIKIITLNDSCSDFDDFIGQFYDYHNYPLNQPTTSINDEISVAAATLSSILIKDDSNDSGISTENTSLDRTPSLDDLPSTSGKTLTIRKLINDSSSSSSDTSSFNSNDDDEEIALAIQAAELANRNEIHAKYQSSDDLIHRLFVCIAGVADQLQTNFASDLRNILKSVFLINTSNLEEKEKEEETKKDEEESTIEYRPSESDVIENEFSVDPNILAQEALFDTNVYFHLDDTQTTDNYTNHPRSDDDNNLRPPIWIPDYEAPKCMSCGVNFTVVKRRHHCRNCGKVFCARCSSNSVPLPKYGLFKPVRVCNKCFIYNLTPFTM